MESYEAIILLFLAAAVFAPFVYAVRTLHGLRHKRLYPILRQTECPGSSRPGSTSSGEDLVVEG